MSTIATLAANNDGTAVASWASLASGETGQAVAIGGYAGPKTIQIGGTFGVGGSVAIQGSNDGTNWDTMSIFDLQAGAYVLLTAISTAQFAMLIENPRFVRAVVTGGDGSTAIRVFISIASLR